MTTTANSAMPPLNDRNLRLWIIPVMVTLATLGNLKVFLQGNLKQFVVFYICNLLFATFTWEICRAALLAARRRYPETVHTRQRIVMWALSCIAIAAIFQAGFIWAMARWVDLPLGVPKSLLFVWVKDFLTSLFFLTLLGSIYEAKYFFEQTKATLEKTENLKKEQARQRLNTLKNKVNPHFLFNSLTSLSALIGEDPQRAEQFVDELANVYRYLLRNNTDTILPLDKVCRFAESYNYLLKNRFEPGFFEVVFDPELGRAGATLGVPALSFQHAIEWLVRTQHPPLHIHIGMHERQIVLFCKNQPKALNMDPAQGEWQQLQAIGATQMQVDHRLVIHIPLHSITISS
jgi:two-component system, LytTR family, sensor kinase